MLAVLLAALVYALLLPSSASAGPILPPLDFCQLVASHCVTLEIGTVNGNGSGTITSSPAGINCTVNAGVKSGDCSEKFTFPTSQATLSVILTATAATGSGACWKYCSVDSDYKPTDGIGIADLPDGYQWTESLFSFRLTKQSLLVTKTGAGTGKVTSEPAGIDCGATCSGSFDYGTQVSLTATPDAGAVFRTWTGACSGQGATCTLTITKATSTNAVFELPTADGGTTMTPLPPPGGPTGSAAGGGASGGQADAEVDADVIGANTGKSRIGKRIVRLELNLDEQVSARLTLVRAGKTLATKQIAKVKPGNRVLILTVPGNVASGKASLRFELKDAVGNTFSGKRRIRIPGK
jgi:hypothetical protein